LENIWPNELPSMNVGPANVGPNVMPNMNPFAHKKMMYDLCKQHIGKTVKLQTIFGNEFPAKIENVDEENVYYTPVNMNRNNDDRWWGGFGGWWWPLLWLRGLGGWWW
jgi:hypothetical protein